MLDSTYYTAVSLQTSCDYFGPYHVNIGRNKTTKYYRVIFTYLNTRACSRLLNHGVYSCTPKISYRERTTQLHYKRQWIPVVYWSRARAKGNDQMMGLRKTAWILSRKRHLVEIYHTGITTSKRMCGSVGEELQFSPKKAYWRVSVDAPRVLYVPVRSNQPRQSKSNWPHSRRPWRWIVPWELASVVSL